ncbi:hypothetical protein L4D76_14610 [Photobacterium sagamiensis]|uniref:hypothetical protein n=1 Tax=Photobacterium sagamiensis TaxID=2910241 RepID=UPI003D0C24F3
METKNGLIQIWLMTGNENNLLASTETDVDGVIISSWLQLEATSLPTPYMASLCDENHNVLKEIFISNKQALLLLERIYQGIIKGADGNHLLL